jgi:hypothetical protein
MRFKNYRKVGKNYIPGALDFSFDICSFIKGANNPIITAFIPNVREIVDPNMTCPFPLVNFT